MPLPVPAGEKRSPGQLRAQYDLERELGAELLGAGLAERHALYADVYRRLHDHQKAAGTLELESNPEARRQEVARRVALLEPFLESGSVFAEFGAGDCSLSLEVARRVARVYAVEPMSGDSDAIQGVGNLELISRGLPPYGIPEVSLSVAFSCHFLEHLHPEDAALHLREVRRLLAPGGRYVCVTPNRLLGPHDVSRYFEDTPRGLHLREYSHSDLANLLREAGFGRTRVLKGIGRPPSAWPMAPFRVVETLLGWVPAGFRRALLSSWGSPPFRPLEQVVLVGTRE